MEKHISGGLPYLINSKTGTYIPLCTYVDDHGNKCEAVLRKVVTIGKKIINVVQTIYPKGAPKDTVNTLAVRQDQGGTATVTTMTPTDK